MDGLKVNISGSILLGPVLILSAHETVDIGSMIKEFELEGLDDYLTRSLAY